jgi:hypothetical protein
MATTSDITAWFSFCSVVSEKLLTGIFSLSSSSLYQNYSTKYEIHFLSRNTNCWAGSYNTWYSVYATESYSKLNILILYNQCHQCIWWSTLLGRGNVSLSRSQYQLSSSMTHGIIACGAICQWLYKLLAEIPGVARDSR